MTGLELLSVVYLAVAADTMSQAPQLDNVAACCDSMLLAVASEVGICNHLSHPPCV